MKKLIARIAVYTGGGSGADAPPLVLVTDYNNKRALRLDYNKLTALNFDFNG